MAMCSMSSGGLFSKPPTELVTHRSTWLRLRMPSNVASWDSSCCTAAGTFRLFLCSKDCRQLQLSEGLCDEFTGLDVSECPETLGTGQRMSWQAHDEACILPSSYFHSRAKRDLPAACCYCISGREHHHDGS